MDVVDGDVAMSATKGGLVPGAVWLSVVWVGASVVFVVVLVFKSMQSVVCVAWEAVSSVLGAA
jgi:hypothetical protein